MKIVSKKVAYSIFVLLLLFVVFIGVLKLPKTQRWNDNLDASFQELSVEGAYPRYLWARDQKWDNYTLVIFLSVLEHTDAHKPLLSLIDLNHERGIGENYWTDGAEKTSDRDMELASYSRYWMGSLIIMYLWLYLFPTSGLRYCFLIVIICLYMQLARYYKRSFEYTALIAATLMAFWPLNGMCLVYGLDIILSLIAMYVFTRRKTQANSYAEWGIVDYFMLGALTMFVCMLSNPLITLGMVLCIHISEELTDHNCNRLKVAKNAIKYSIAWCMGYIVWMELKGLLTELFGGTASGSGRVIELLGTGTMLERGITSIMLFARFVYPWIAVWAAIVIMFFIVIYRKAYNWKKTMRLWPVLMIGFYPFIWEFVFYGHTGHGHEANLYVITVFAAFMVIFKSIDFKQLGFEQIWKKQHE